VERIAALVGLVFMIGVVGAHAGDHSNLPEPGNTPVSPLFGLEKAQESVGLALTFNKEKKAHKKLHMAQERLSEAEKLSDNNDSKNAEKAVKMHSKAMENAEKAVKALPEDKREEAGKQLNESRQDSMAVLQDLKQKLPESAMKGINTAIDAHESAVSPDRRPQDPGQPQRPNSPNDTTDSQNQSPGQYGEDQVNQTESPEDNQTSDQNFDEPPAS